MSIPCFTNCLKYSPANLDCLLSLGVSCTNVLDEVKAMNYLKRWIMLNPKYKMEGINNIIPDEMVNLPTYKVQEIKQINEQLIKVFDEAAKINPNDPELLVSPSLSSPPWPFSSSLSGSTRCQSTSLIARSTSTPPTIYL